MFTHPDPMIEFLVKQAEWADFDIQELRRKELEEVEEYEPTEEDEEEFYQFKQQSILDECF